MKSLLDLILHALAENPLVSELAPKAERIIKDEAKRYFFEGKIKTFIHFIFGESNPEMEQNFNDQFAKIGIQEDSFLKNIKLNILQEIETQQVSKDLDGLLKLLGYEHLKPFISLFKK
jgi:hypothetical protein